MPLSFGVALIVGKSLFSGWLLNSFCSDASGAGIPQLKALFWQNFGLHVIPCVVSEIHRGARCKSVAVAVWRAKTLALN